MSCVLSRRMHAHALTDAIASILSMRTCGRSPSMSAVRTGAPVRALDAEPEGPGPVECRRAVAMRGYLGILIMVHAN